MTEGSLESPLYKSISGRVQALLYASFSLFFLGSRIPQFTAQWDGEDGNGHLAAMLMGLSSPNELIFSRIDGAAHYQVGFPHPLPPYLFISLIGRLVGTVVPFTALHGQTLIFALKATASLLQLAVFLAFLVLAVRFARSKVAIVWLWVMAITPVALYSSNEVQPDSSTGFVLVALFFMGAIIAQAPEASWAARVSALFVGSFAVGLGKNEWTFCLAAALLFAALAHPLIHYLLVRKRKLDPAGPTYDALTILCAAAAGLVCGNCANYLLNSSDYMGGWDLLRIMIFRATPLSGDTSTWWLYFQQKLPYIAFHFVVDASILIHLLKRPKLYSATVALAILFANALFWSYVISSWGSFPRYFAPAYIGLGAGFLIILTRLPARDTSSWTVTATIVLVALQSAYYQRTSQYWRLWRGNTDIPAWISNHEKDPGRCVLVVDYSFVLDRPNVDFIHAPSGQEFVDQYLTKIHRAACPR